MLTAIPFAGTHLFSLRRILNCNNVQPCFLSMANSGKIWGLGSVKNECYHWNCISKMRPYCHRLQLSPIEKAKVSFAVYSLYIEHLILCVCMLWWWLFSYYLNYMNPCYFISETVLQRNCTKWPGYPIYWGPHFQYCVCSFILASLNSDFSMDAVFALKYVHTHKCMWI